MALTQGAWTSKTVNGVAVVECEVTATTSENDLYTLKVPKNMLDTRKPFTLHVNVDGATLDASALPVDIYGGWADSFAMSGDGATIGATDGALIAADVIDDVKGVANAVHIDPNYNAAKVQSTLAGVRGIVNCGTPAYFAFNLDGASTLAAATCKFIITQG